MDLREQLIRDEGWRLKPYLDTVGKLSIGVGRNLDDVGLRPVEVEFMLQNDIAERHESLSQFSWFTNLNDVRQGVIINMAFMGLARLLEFTQMIAALEAEDWARAADEMLDSRWAEQVGARAERLALQMRDGGRFV